MVDYITAQWIQIYQGRKYLEQEVKQGRKGGKQMAEVIAYEFSTTKLKEDGTTVGQAQEFLLEVMDYADERPAKTNRSITREQAWNIFIGALIGKPEESFVDSLIIRKINNEFAI